MQISSRVPCESSSSIPQNPPANVGAPPVMAGASIRVFSQTLTVAPRFRRSAESAPSRPARVSKRSAVGLSRLALLALAATCISTSSLWADQKKLRDDQRVEILRGLDAEYATVKV